MWNHRHHQLYLQIDIDSDFLHNLLVGRTEIADCTILAAAAGAGTEHNRFQRNLELIVDRIDRAEVVVADNIVELVDFQQQEAVDQLVDQLDLDLVLLAGIELTEVERIHLRLD